MTTKLSITTGPLVAELNFADDAKAQATLLLFYQAFDLGPTDATPKQKLEAIVNWLALFVRQKAVQYYIEQSRAAATTEAENLYDLGGVRVEPSN